MVSLSSAAVSPQGFRLEVAKWPSAHLQMQPWHRPRNRVYREQLTAFAYFLKKNKAEQVCVLELLCYRNNRLCFPGTPWRRGTSPGTSTQSKAILLTQPPGTPWLWLSITALHLQPLDADLIQPYPSMQKINNIIYKGQKNTFHKSEPICSCKIYIWIKKGTL